MATTVLPNDDTHTETDGKNLEIFCLIWLDANENVEEARDTEQKLRSIINHLKKFQDIKQCQEYIEQRSTKERLVLIVSGRLGRDIVPSIHNLRQIMSIYVYCMDKKSNEEWACEFAKVKNVVVDLDELISQIKGDHRVQKKVEEPLSINIFTTNVDGGKSTTGLNGQFVFYQVLIDCLLRLKSTETDKTEFINLCKIEYDDNHNELNNLREFEEEYSSNKVLWWYTRESFFYRTLNAALRTQNIHMIFLYRSFIFDIHRQLQSYQSKNILKVYRSQLISSDELETLKQSLNHFISVNSFFSTSTNYRKALSFLDLSATSYKLERVLFEIQANPKMATTKSFADISNHSEFADESEVLFMMGSIFRLKSIYCNDDQIWIIQMTLCNDDEHDLKQVLFHMKQQIGSGETNLRTLGKVLWKMGKLDLAQKYFIRLLPQLSSNDPLLGNLYEDLGELASQTGDYDISIQWHQKLLEFKKQNESTVISIMRKVSSLIGQSVHSTNIDTNRKWKQYGVTVAGGNSVGGELNQLYWPEGIYVDDDHQCIYIAEYLNHRIVQWKWGTKNGQVVAGGNGKGDRMDQLNYPTNVIVDKNNDLLIICDFGNKRVVQWPCQNGTIGQIMISDIDCWGITMDNNGNLYVSDYKKNEVRRWNVGNEKGTIIAGGNGEGNDLNQLNWPVYLFVDEDHSVYVSDYYNHRVVKWTKNAKEGIVVAGGQSEGNSLTQLSRPYGVIVDHMGHVYIADSWNDRIMCWLPGSSEGSIVVGGNGKGKKANHFNNIRGLSFDRHGNLYVVDRDNNRVQKFDIISS